MQDKHTKNSSNANKASDDALAKFNQLPARQQHIITALVDELLGNLQQPANTATLPPLLYQQPETAYLICTEWALAASGHSWAYVVGLLDGISTQQLDPESKDALDFLAVLARFRGFMAQEVQP